MAVISGKPQSHPTYLPVIRQHFHLESMLLVIFAWFFSSCTCNAHDKIAEMSLQYLGGESRMLEMVACQEQQIVERKGLICFDIGSPQAWHVVFSVYNCIMKKRNHKHLNGKCEKITGPEQIQKCVEESTHVEVLLTIFQKILERCFQATEQALAHEINAHVSRIFTSVKSFGDVLIDHVEEVDQLQRAAERSALILKDLSDRKIRAITHMQNLVKESQISSKRIVESQDNLCQALRIAEDTSKELQNGVEATLGRIKKVVAKLDGLMDGPCDANEGNQNTNWILTAIFVILLVIVLSLMTKEANSLSHIATIKVLILLLAWVTYASAQFSWKNISVLEKGCMMSWISAVSPLPHEVQSAFLYLVKSLAISFGVLCALGCIVLFSNITASLSN